MIRMANRLWRWEQKKLRKKTEEAKKRGGVSASLFLEADMNALSDADCFFFYGSRVRPKGLLTVFFPDEEHAEITVAQFVPGDNIVTMLYKCALNECSRVGAEQVHTVRNPVCGFDLKKIEGISFSYDWSEYMLCNEMAVLATMETKDAGTAAELKKEEAPEADGTLRYVLLCDGQKAAECRLLSTAGGTQFYLFGLKTEEKFRRTGMASCLLKELAKEYSENPEAVLRLQVSSKNEPAMCLYRKLGFRTEEEREYYKTKEC